MKNMATNIVFSAIVIGGAGVILTAAVNNLPKLGALGALISIGAGAFQVYQARRSHRSTASHS
jgi:hypothetical protein